MERWKGIFHRNLITIVLVLVALTVGTTYWAYQLQQRLDLLQEAGGIAVVALAKGHLELHNLIDDQCATIDKLTADNTKLENELRSLTRRVNTLADRPTKGPANAATAPTTAIRLDYNLDRGTTFATGTSLTGWYLQTEVRDNSHGSFNWGNEPAVLPERRPLVYRPGRSPNTP